MDLEQKPILSQGPHDGGVDRSVKLIGVDKVEEMLGVSRMTLWRWAQREDLNFPKPIKIAKRRFWYLEELVAWLDARPRG